MSTLLHNICRATFVIPWTSGLIKERRNVGFSVHDGSIAGVVLLTTVVIIIFETLLVLPINKSKILMIGLLCVAILCLVCSSIAVALRSHWTVRRTVKPSDKLKLTFLWIFVIGNIIYQAMQLALHIVCNIVDDTTNIYYGFTWTFQIFQTIFIHHFSRFRFANMLCLYYGLLVLFVTNISMWTQQTIYSYLMKHPTDPINISDFMNTSNCGNNTVLVDTLNFLEPYLEPVLLEYCLLSLIFISEMWPKQKFKNERLEFDDSVSAEDSTEIDPLLNNSVGSLTTHQALWNRTSFCVVFISLIYSASFVVFECVLIYVPTAQQYITISNAYFFCGNILRIPVIIRAFYAFSGELRPKMSYRSWITMNHCVILASSFATCGYYVIECFTMEGSGSLDETDVLYTINAIFRTIATILQTSFILQVKQYRKTGDQRPFRSIQNTFLFLCCSNFGIWFSYTFVTARYRSEMRHDFLFENFWYPFTIFYHFECFVSFYRSFKENK